MTYVFNYLGSNCTFEGFRAMYKSVFGNDYYEFTDADDIPTGLISTSNDEFVTIKNGRVRLWIDDGNDKNEYIMEVANRNEIIGTLADMLHEFDVNMNRYQTDVYMYIDDNGKARLTTFTNVGGNSWMDDEHYTLYTDKEHHEDMTDVYNSIEEISDAIQIDKSVLIKQVAEEEHIEEMEIGYNDVAYFVKNKRHDELVNAYKEYLNLLDGNGNYVDIAREIVDNFEKDSEAWSILD